MFQQHLNKHAGPRNENALTMLRAKKLRRGTAVWTADNRNIGTAIRMYHRQKDVAPNLKLYGSYLQLFSVKLGGATYIPTDFIRDYDLVENKVTLSVTLDDIAIETWNREPLFIAGGATVTEVLA